jgi:hypothetical protein
LQPGDIRGAAGLRKDRLLRALAARPILAPEEVHMSDDQREREPLRDRGDNPPEAGVRSDLGGTSEGSSPVAPGAANVSRIDEQAESGSGEAGPRDPLADGQHPTADE